MQELKALLQSRLASAELDEAAPLSATDLATGRGLFKD
jgi:hypothetical protein